MGAAERLPAGAVGVHCTGDWIDTVLELEVYNDGRWELTARKYGKAPCVLAEGTIAKEEG